MNSRERVLTAFAHQEPDRVPCWCGASEEFWTKAKQQLGLDDEGLRLRLGDDFRRVFDRYVGPTIPLSPGATSRTIFGIERQGLGYGHPIHHPLAHATLEQVHAHAWPEPKWIAVDHLRDEALRYNRQYAILGGNWSPFWHDVIDLVGMETLYLKMYDEPEVVEAIFEKVIEFYLAVNQRIFEAAGDVIDIFFIGNDFGSQTGPLLGENLFRRFVLPHLKRLIDLGHAYKLKVMLHSCGAISELIPALIEVGLDGLHAVQPDCRGMDLARLKKDFGQKILFNGAIDSHHVLIKGNPDFVRRKTCEVLDLMKSGGGYIAGASHDTILEETPLENALTMFDIIREYGKYT